MRRTSLPVLGTHNHNVGRSGLAAADGKSAVDLGVLSVHFDGGRCHVRCAFCYLGEREGTAQSGVPVELLCASLEQLPYQELAIALSEPVEPVLGTLRRLVEVATAHGRLVTVTTTIAGALSLPKVAWQGIGRLNVSIDPQKGQMRAPVGQVIPQDVAEALRMLPAEVEKVLIVTLSSQPFAEELWSGLLAALVALPEVDRVALSGLKPPPPWCDSSYWLRSLARIGGLLREHLDQRLFLDCYVAARILKVGGCPARPDLSPTSKEESSRGRLAFRSCVYQPRADFVVESAEALAAQLADFAAPERCPFPIH